ncbi:hypothetical protein T440DRAFT_518402 [Plenodomus tracheiphilus IPT5]|uniref:Subtilisin-like protein n=1 Tax=Plenodomus tracheiphilus IPT5 TaxID=1408161 RepID=A0A6A7B4P8_9PLEO|nr:hypothetical protein T440DRAFT_518402 [Plenodomus tracheiphilus IPT5]
MRLLLFVSGALPVLSVIASSFTSDDRRSKLGGPIQRRDALEYDVMANTSIDWQKTEEFLKTKVKPDTAFVQFKDFEDDSKVFGWYPLVLDDAAKAEVEKYEGVASVEISKNLTTFRAISASGLSQSSQDAFRMRARSSKLLTRAGDWVKQEHADDALKMASQYNGADFSKLTDFVHVPEPGKGSFVYVMGPGVRLHAVGEMRYEFHPPDDLPDKIEVLQTDLSKIMKQDRAKDGSKDAKQVTLVSVKMTVYELDFQVAFKKIIAHYDSNADGKDRSVIVIASSSEDTDTLENVKKLPQWLNNYEEPMKAVLEKEMPVINVGSANYEGEKSKFSQAGQVNVYAPGEKVVGMGSKDKDPVTDTGTSFGAPQVAGLIATYLSHELTRKQWDGKSGISCIEEITKYLVSDDSSWIRKSGSDTRMIWNGAKEEDHKNAGANGQSNPTSPAPKTKALSIILQNNIDFISNSFEWKFRLTDYGQSTVCHGDDVFGSGIGGEPAMIDSPPLPGGSYSFKIDNMDCEYKNDGTNAGAL